MDKSLKVRAFNEVYLFLKKDKRFASQGEFAEMIGKTQPYVSAMLAGKKPISSNTIEIIRVKFGVNLYDYLSTEHTGETIGELMSANAIKFVPAEVRLEYATVGKAQTDFAKWIRDDNTEEEKETLRVFEMPGKTMTPALNTGDFIICKQTTLDKKLRNHISEIFVIITYGGQMLVKRLLAVKEDENAYKFGADDSKYPPVDLTDEEVKEIWQATKVLRYIL